MVFTIYGDSNITFQLSYRNPPILKENSVAISKSAVRLSPTATLRAGLPRPGRRRCSCGPPGCHGDSPTSPASCVRRACYSPRPTLLPLSRWYRDGHTALPGTRCLHWRVGPFNPEASFLHSTVEGLLAVGLGALGRDGLWVSDEGKRYRALTHSLTLFHELRTLARVLS